MKQCSGHWIQAGEDVSWRGSFLTSLISCTELSNGQQQIDIVASNKILSHGYYCLAQRNFTMVICRVLSHISTQLSHFDFTFEFPLEAREQNLTLPWLQSITKARDGASAISY
jgi:hypothetical protein